MANITINISGMKGEVNTYFTDSPVVINIDGLRLPDGSRIMVCKLHVLYENDVKGEFSGEVNNSTNGQTLTFDISSALRAIWAEYDFSQEVEAAQSAAAGGGSSMVVSRLAKAYQLKVYLEYISDADGGHTVIESDIYNAGYCIAGGMTEMERLTVRSGDVSVLQNTNLRNGDASTKPKDTPERVGKDSITSWVDFDDIDPSASVVQPATITHFYPASASAEEDPLQANDHAPLVLRDNVPYIDFIFTNRRGAVETCSALMKEALDITISTKQYSKTGIPSFKPYPSLIATGSEGRRSWSMSSGYVTREWAEWWVMEFLAARRRKRWWMLYNGAFLPVTVQPTKNAVRIYDRAKQEMVSVDFTVTLALEG